MDTKTIINFCPTGMIPTKEMTPYVPISVSEIVEDVHRAIELGVTMVHLHARDQDSQAPTYKKEIYGEMIEKIRQIDPYIVICVSLSGRNFKEIEKRAEPLYLDGKSKPDMGSLTLSSLNFNKVSSTNSPDTIQSLASIMKERGIVPELEAFDSGMINYSNYLIRKELLEPPFYFNLLLGNIACAQANLLHLGVMINDLPKDSLWSVAGIGDSQLKMNSISLAYGGGVRVGLEDNIWYDSNRKKLATNDDLLRRVHKIADVNSRQIMSSSEFRGLMDLAEGNGKYGRKFSKTLPAFNS